MKNQTLSGHTTPDTAYLVDDYPYGFRLRCKIRYWLEFKPSQGFRLWSQTSNPKRPGLVWNKPKASIYARFGGAMYLNGEGHVTWAGLTEYSDLPACVAFNENFGATMPEEAQKVLRYWITRKLSLEQAKNEGRVTVKTTVTHYGDITGGVLAPIDEPTVTEEVLKPQHTPAELAAMGRTLRTGGELAQQLAKFQQNGGTLE